MLKSLRVVRGCNSERTDSLTPTLFCGATGTGRFQHTNYHALSTSCLCLDFLLRNPPPAHSAAQRSLAIDNEYIESPCRTCMDLLI